jgi:squalene-hopene/tetraprenyl-beta-curcumene cyclase
MSTDEIAFQETRLNARRALLAARTADGHWEGELSSSALSTATAVFALLSKRDPPFQQQIEHGLHWLSANRNSDGGWGDTTKSLSNISTTSLCWAVLGAAGRASDAPATEAAEAWLTSHVGSVDPAHLIPAIIARYGRDHTFSVPILTMCALAGRLGEGREAWRRIPQLPFELAALPQRWFKRLRLPVVSYALPALIAIGLVRHRNRPTRNPVTRIARELGAARALRLLERIQPTSGGFLEAMPLTSFVVMSLIGAGLSEHPVVARGIEFLLRSQRADGSWPIDTNLATWVTTLSINALATDPKFEQFLPAEERYRIRDWLLDQQYRKEHPYTLADPGGWAWTNLIGGVPDADDTPGAMLALRSLGKDDERTKTAALEGAWWLHNLQNRDGGIPTFCSGWGRMPFDRSSADLTAHTLRAWAAWADAYPGQLYELLDLAGTWAVAFLVHQQREDGAWSPLWFGNQHNRDEENLTYGTARVLMATACISTERWNSVAQKGIAWLLATQNPDGGWGGGAPASPSSIEETAIAIESLATVARVKWDKSPEDRKERCRQAIERGVAWLIANSDRGQRFDPVPIGFYFAKLWYFEKLYPVIFTVAALNAAAAFFETRSVVGQPSAFGTG